MILLKILVTNQFIVDNSNFVLKNSAIIYWCVKYKYDDEGYDQYMEETVMLINPVERYCVDKGRKEGMEKGKLDVAKNLLSEDFLLMRLLSLQVCLKRIF